MAHHQRHRNRTPPTAEERMRIAFGQAMVAERKFEVVDIDGVTVAGRGWVQFHHDGSLRITPIRDWTRQELPHA